MKKLYLLLINSILLLGSTSVFCLTVAGCSSKENDSAPIKSVIDTLKGFDQKHPLKIDYLDQDALAHIYKKSVAKKVKEALTSSKSIFTPTVLDKIHFGRSAVLNPGVPVRVQVKYIAKPSERARVTHFYILEDANASHQVYDALKIFNSKNPIVISYNKTNPTAPASDSAFAPLIKARMKLNNPVVFTDKVLKQITFSNTHLNPGSLVKVSATYLKKTTPIYVKESISTEKVISALKKFNTSATAVKIYAEYNGKYADEFAVAKGEQKAGDAIRDYLSGHDEQISPFIKTKISFNHVLLKRSPVSVTASYRGESVKILVQIETVKAEVRRVLNQFSQKSHRLKIQHTQAECDAGKDMIFSDDLYGAQKIRNALVQQGGLSRDLADRINFTTNCIAFNLKDRKSPDPGRLWKTEATFKKDKIEIKLMIYGSTNM